MLRIPFTEDVVKDKKDTRWKSERKSVLEYIMRKECIGNLTLAGHWGQERQWKTMHGLHNEFVWMDGRGNGYKREEIADSYEDHEESWHIEKENQF